MCHCRVGTDVQLVPTLLFSGSSFVLVIFGDELVQRFVIGCRQIRLNQCHYRRDGSTISMNSSTALLPRTSDVGNVTSSNLA